jgi:hypothetical protein
MVLMALLLAFAAYSVKENTHDLKTGFCIVEKHAGRRQVMQNSDKLYCGA